MTASSFSLLSAIAALLLHSLLPAIRRLHPFGLRLERPRLPRMPWCSHTRLSQPRRPRIRRQSPQWQQRRRCLLLHRRRLQGGAQQGGTARQGVQQRLGHGHAASIAMPMPGLTLGIAARLIFANSRRRMRSRSCQLRSRMSACPAPAAVGLLPPLGACCGPATAAGSSPLPQLLACGSLLHCCPADGAHGVGAGAAAAAAASRRAPAAVLLAAASSARTWCMLEMRNASTSDRCSSTSWARRRTCRSSLVRTASSLRVLSGDWGWRIERRCRRQGGGRKRGRGSIAGRGVAVPGITCAASLSPPSRRPTAPAAAAPGPSSPVGDRCGGAARLSRRGAGTRPPPPSAPTQLSL